MKIIKQYIIQHQRPIYSVLKALALGLMLVQGAHADQHESNALTIDPAIGQAIFANPELASQALAVAIADSNVEMLHQMFGDAAAQLLPFEKINQAKIDAFAEQYANTHTFQAEGPRRYVLEIGKNGWAFPVPIALGKVGWYFDTEEGLERVRIRRIGENELAVMQASLAYYDAQLEYASEDRDGDGVLEYAQNFVSSDGMQDGLFWETPLDSAPSPLGPLFADKTPDESYFGYRYKILTSQGEHATDGGLDYIESTNMTRGFAMLAWPAIYNVTGVMSFMVNQEGRVYSMNLGQDTAEVVLTILNYEPGPDWKQEAHILP